MKTKWDVATATTYIKKCEQNGTTGIKYWGAKDFLVKAKAGKLEEKNKDE